jgi:hypothetical protein
MTLDKKTFQLVIPGAATSLAQTVGLKWDFAEVIGFRFTNVTDTGTQIEIKDADARIVYKDAADKNYTTGAPTDKVISLDVTTTGLSVTPADSTGAAVTVGLGMALPVKSPLTFTWSNGTAGDTGTLNVYTRGPISRQNLTLTVPTPAATASGTMALGCRYAQVLGFSALLTGTDTAVSLKAVDADSRVFFLDAADRDIKTARQNIFFALDDTLTGLTPQQVDATGAAATATAAAPYPVVTSPLTLSVLNGGTAGDVISWDVYYRTT